MKIKLKYSDLSEFLLKFAIILYFSFYFINNSYMNALPAFPELKMAALYGSIMLLITVVLMRTKMTLTVLLMKTILIGVSLLVSRNVERGFEFLVLILFLLAGENSDAEDILKFAFWTDMIWLIGIVTLALTGVIENRVASTYMHENRVFLGFTAPNAGQLLYFCMLLFIAYKKENITLFHIFLFAAGTLVLFHYSDVKAALAYSLLILLILLAVKMFGFEAWDRKWLHGISYLLIGFCLVISFVVPYLYLKGVKLMEVLNELTTSRVYQASLALKQYGLTLFGQLMNFNYGFGGKTNANEAYFYLDSSYLKYAFMYGLVFLGLIMYLYHRMIQFAVEKKNVYLLISAIGALTYFIWNPQLLYIVYNPFLIVLLTYLKTDSADDEDELEGQKGAEYYV